MLADIGGGINLHDDNGDTPLLLSARLSQPAVALCLLQRGKICIWALLSLFSFSLYSFIFHFHLKKVIIFLKCNCVITIYCLNSNIIYLII